MAKTNRRKNLHHMAWPKRDYNGVRKEARALPCLQVMLDVEVHRVLHDMYNYPRLMAMEDAVFLVGRHKNKVCGCYDRSGNELINILNINGGDEDGNTDGQMQPLW